MSLDLHANINISRHCFLGEAGREVEWGEMTVIFLYWSECLNRATDKTPLGGCHVSLLVFMKNLCGWIQWILGRTLYRPGILASLHHLLAVRSVTYFELQF